MTPPGQQDPAAEEIRELWELVEELGDLSIRLTRAADAAMEALGDRAAPQSKEDRT